MHDHPPPSPRGPVIFDSRFLILHKNKVVSYFYFNMDLVLPSLCTTPPHPKEILLHKLNVVQAIRVTFRLLHPFVLSFPVC